MRSKRKIENYLSEKIVIKCHKFTKTQRITKITSFNFNVPKIKDGIRRFVV